MFKDLFKSVENKKEKCNIKKICAVFCCFLSLFLIAGCAVQPAKSEAYSSEEYKAACQKRLDWKRLNYLDVIINMDAVNANQMDSPWVADRVTLPDNTTVVSLDKLRMLMHSYEFFKSTQLNITAEDIISLYETPNDSVQKEYDEFYTWFLYRTPGYGESDYLDFGKIAYRLYKENNGQNFADKKSNMLTADEWFELINWAKENIDYDFLNEIVHGNCQQGDEIYYQILYELGLVSIEGGSI